MAREIKIKPNIYQKAVHRFLMLKPVSAFLSVVLYHADSFMLRLTSGRYTITRIVGLPIIQLTTIGAKTGLQRTMPLVSLLDREKIAIVASNFGQKHNPGWYYNLKAHPECEVRFNGQTRKYIAREVFGDEHDHYFYIAADYYSGYEKYKERASPRRIPVMVLEPKG